MATNLAELVKSKTDISGRILLGEGYIVQPGNYHSEIGYSIGRMIHSVVMSFNPIRDTRLGHLEGMEFHIENEFFYVPFSKIIRSDAKTLDGKIETVEKVIFCNPIPEGSKYIQPEGKNLILVHRRTGGEVYKFSVTLSDHERTFFYREEEKEKAIEKLAEYVIEGLRHVSIAGEKINTKRIVRFIQDQIATK